jgi:hypothetical protein
LPPGTTLTEQGGITSLGDANADDANLKIGARLICDASSTGTPIVGSVKTAADSNRSMWELDSEAEFRDKSYAELPTPAKAHAFRDAAGVAAACVFVPILLMWLLGGAVAWIVAGFWQSRRRP